jgi:ATP-dependent protease ClpP protease subunit
MAEDGDDEGGDSEDMPVRFGTSIMFHCDVSVRTVNKLVVLLHEVRALAIWSSFHRPTVCIYIHSNGGDVYAGLSAMGHIRRFDGRVFTVADGFVASAATLLLLAGHTRQIAAHSDVLIHQMRTSFDGKYEELRDEWTNATRLMEVFRRIYSDCTSIPADELDAYLKSERCMNAEECVRYGVVEVIL